MERSHILPLGAALLAAVAATPAQAADDTQIWTTATVNVKLADKLKFSNELVARFSDTKNGLYELENSALLGYQINDHISAWAGYVHNPQYSDGDFTVMERRLREQVVFDNIAQLGKAKFGARIRTEQRWRDHIDGTGWRVRPYVKMSVPLGDKSAPSFNLSHESFINLNTTKFQAVSGFDRMRNAATLSFPVTSTLKGEFGYLNQYRFVRHAPDTMDHALTAALTLSF